MAESLPASCRIVAVSLAGLGDQSRWTGCRSGERYSAFYRSHCTEILLAALLITPLARYAKQPLLIRTRRLLGLWCFAWATLHLTSYALLELGVNNLALLGKELITRPYLTLGIISWVILLALAFTSTQSMQRKLGKHWQQLHNFVYLVAILAPIHYLWSVKIISPQPLIYAGLAVLLLALRYKKLLSFSTGYASRPTTNYLYNFILPTNFALSRPDAARAPYPAHTDRIKLCFVCHQPFITRIIYFISIR